MVSGLDAAPAMDITDQQNGVWTPPTAPDNCLHMRGDPHTASEKSGRWFALFRGDFENLLEKVESFFFEITLRKPYQIENDRPSNESKGLKRTFAQWRALYSSYCGLARQCTCSCLGIRTQRECRCLESARRNLAVC